MRRWYNWICDMEFLLCFYVWFLFSCALSFSLQDSSCFPISCHVVYGWDWVSIVMLYCSKLLFSFCIVLQNRSSDG